MQALAMGVPLERVTLIRNGVDVGRLPARPSAARASFRQSLGIAPETPLVGFVGRIDVEKGPDQFLQAAQVIHAEVPQARFVMVGTGHQYDKMQGLTRGAGAGRTYVHFAGLWPDTSQVYPGIDLLLQTSRIEGLPCRCSKRWRAGCPWWRLAWVACPRSSKKDAPAC